MLNTSLDHIIVAARTLDEATAWVENQLGVIVPPGGRHEMMGTHNRVMSLGHNRYLEVIAVHPGMSPPDRPRWFGLDDPSVMHRLADSPRLLTWAVNTCALDALVESSLLTIGKIREARRDDLEWKVAIPDDGRLVAAGFFPLCMQWLTDPHPASRIPDLGFRLQNLTLHHPYPEWMAGVLHAIGADSEVTIKGVQDPAEARLTARIATPTGIQELSS